MDLKNFKRMLNMNYKDFNKNFIAIILLMLFWILLLNTYTFNQFTNTILGRFVMILIIIGVSCVNKMFGIIGVLSIFAFLNLKKTHAEGFDNNTISKQKITSENIDDINYNDDDNDTTSNNEMDDNITITIKQHKKNKKIIKNNLNLPILTDDINDTIDDTNSDNSETSVNDDTDDTNDNTDKTEGFDILSLERILFGKSKKKINIDNKNNKKIKNVLPANANDLQNNNYK